MPNDNDNDQTAATKADMREVLDGVVERIAAEFTAFRGELKTFADNFDRRLERIGDAIRSIDGRLSVMTRWADTLDRDNANLNSEYHALKRSNAALEARVRKLEERFA